jgi:thiol:disulfide interchange protein DsbD
MITGIFASPCVGPILIAVLTYAAQSKNMVFSFFLLFTYALGLGQIFLVLSLFSNLINKLPRSGQWMNGIKYLLAGLLILAGLFFFIPAVKSLTKTKDIAYTDQLNRALKSNKIVIVDFKADWCGACKELENKTFKDPQVLSFLSQNEFLAIDVTVTNEETNELLQKYKVMGLPHVMFFDKDGNLLPELTISSYISPKQMLEKIEILKTIGTDK